MMFHLTSTFKKLFGLLEYVFMNLTDLNEHNNDLTPVIFEVLYIQHTLMRTTF